MRPKDNENPTDSAQGRLKDILEMCSRRRIAVERVPRSQLDGLGDGNQGVALQTSPYPYTDFLDIIETAQRSTALPFILILDALQDPQNLGTLLRTAEAVGVHGVLLPLAHTATVTPAVVSASSGACEHLQIAQWNLAQAMDILKENEIWLIGLEADEAAQTPTQIGLNRPLALIVGSEGKGMRSLTRNRCDLLLRLPMCGKVASLNAAAAGSVALYLAWQARGFSSSSPLVSD